MLPVCSKGKGRGTSSQSLHLPDVDSVLPLQVALQGLPDQQPAAVKAVYNHWCKKRMGSERPLLQRLWYEPPWHRLTVAGDSFFVRKLFCPLVSNLGNHVLLTCPSFDSSFSQSGFSDCILQVLSFAASRYMFNGGKHFTPLDTCLNLLLA